MTVDFSMKSLLSSESDLRETCVRVLERPSPSRDPPGSLSNTTRLRSGPSGVRGPYTVARTRTRVDERQDVSRSVREDGFGPSDPCVSRRDDQLSRSL